MSTQVYANGVLIEEWDDDARAYTDHRTGESRPYTADENADADQSVAQRALLTDLEARVARIEAHLWPSPDAPTDPTDETIPTWDTLGGVWPAGGLLRDAGKVWRNTTTVPLTTPPSGFPGQPSQWGHLFAEVTTTPPPDPDPDPATPDGYVGAWDKNATYTVGNVVSKDGHYWRCLIAHGAEYQGTWAPGIAHAVWTDNGPI